MMMSYSYLESLRPTYLKLIGISLSPWSDDAKTVLKNYHFPGNIRQLKNLVQQISVLEMQRELSADTLRKYLPSDRNLPAVIGANGVENFSEREILYKVLFDMKSDVNELKGLVLKMLKDETTGQEILRDHGHLFEEDKTELSLPEPVTPTESEPIIITTPTDSDDFHVEVEDISHEDEEESLSLEKQEKQMIIKALNKNRNKRKYAALDLGISERTLYRKIKQYGLEDL